MLHSNDMNLVLFYINKETLKRMVTKLGESSLVHFVDVHEFNKISGRIEREFGDEVRMIEKVMNRVSFLDDDTRDVVGDVLQCNSANESVRLKDVDESDCDNNVPSVNGEYQTPSDSKNGNLNHTNYNNTNFNHNNLYNNDITNNLNERDERLNNKYDELNNANNMNNTNTNYHEELNGINNYDSRNNTNNNDNTNNISNINTNNKHNHINDNMYDRLNINNNLFPSPNEHDNDDIYSRDSFISTMTHLDRHYNRLIHLTEIRKDTLKRLKTFATRLLILTAVDDILTESHSQKVIDTLDLNDNDSLEDTKHNLDFVCFNLDKEKGLVLERVLYECLKRNFVIFKKGSSLNDLVGMSDRNSGCRVYDVFGNRDNRGDFSNDNGRDFGNDNRGDFGNDDGRGVVNMNGYNECGYDDKKVSNDDLSNNNDTNNACNIDKVDNLRVNNKESNNYNNAGCNLDKIDSHDISNTNLTDSKILFPSGVNFPFNKSDDTLANAYLSTTTCTRMTLSEISSILTPITNLPQITSYVIFTHGTNALNKIRYIINSLGGEPMDQSQVNHGIRGMKNILSQLIKVYNTNEEALYNERMRIRSMIEEWKFIIGREYRIYKAMDTFVSGCDDNVDLLVGEGFVLKDRMEDMKGIFEYVNSKSGSCSYEVIKKYYDDNKNESELDVCMDEVIFDGDKVKSKEMKLRGSDKIEMDDFYIDDRGSREESSESIHAEDPFYADEEDKESNESIHAEDPFYADEEDKESYESIHAEDPFYADEEDKESYESIHAENSFYADEDRDSIDSINSDDTNSNDDIHANTNLDANGNKRNSKENIYAKDGISKNNIHANLDNSIYADNEDTSSGTNEKYKNKSNESIHADKEKSDEESIGSINSSNSDNYTKKNEDSTSKSDSNINNRTETSIAKKRDTSSLSPQIYINKTDDGNIITKSIANTPLPPNTDKVIEVYHPLVIEIPTYPPAHFTLNKFTSSFQDISNVYGVPCFGEVNPGIFYISLFPFMFGCMFGDVGHGLILLILSLYMIKKERHLNQIIPESIRMIFDGRYIMLLCSIWSIFFGFIYCDFLGFPIEIFPSQFEPIKDINKEKDGYVYPFGLDYMWHHDPVNGQVFLNSLKMKLSIILGFYHMSLGIFIGYFNAIRKRDTITVFCLLVPQSLTFFCFVGYLVFLIYYKWIVPGLGNVSIIGIIVGMFTQPLTINEEMYYGQKYVQLMLFCTILVCIPWMFLSKPLYVTLKGNRNKKKKNTENKVDNSLYKIIDSDKGFNINNNIGNKRNNSNYKIIDKGFNSKNKKNTGNTSNLNKIDSGKGNKIYTRDDMGNSNYKMIDSDHIKEKSEIFNANNFTKNDINERTNTNGSNKSSEGNRSITSNEIIKQYRSSPKRRKNNKNLNSYPIKKNKIKTNFIIRNQKKEKESLVDLWTHSVIETIEFCIGLVSNTSSYLRLWAISLAHSQITTVLNSMTIFKENAGIIYKVMSFPVYIVFTVCLLIGLEGLSSCLHALRLNWIEFNGRFFKGGGYLFRPLTFDMAVEDDD